MRINKLLIFLFIIVIYSCAKETGCVEITFKEESNGNFYFHWGPLTAALGIDEDGSGQPFSGSVSEQVYNEFEIGDTYCVED